MAYGRDHIAPDLPTPPPLGPTFGFTEAWGDRVGKMPVGFFSLLDVGQRWIDMLIEAQVGLQIPGPTWNFHCIVNQTHDSGSLVRRRHHKNHGCAVAVFLTSLPSLPSFCHSPIWNILVANKTSKTLTASPRLWQSAGAAHWWHRSLGVRSNFSCSSVQHWRSPNHHSSKLK